MVCQNAIPAAADFSIKIITMTPALAVLLVTTMCLSG